MSTDPDAPRSSDPLREPPLQAGLPPDAWRLLTNFTRPSLIPQTFGVWPDDVASLKTLADIYAGKAQSVLGMFPFLDHGEGSRLEAVFQAHRERIYAPFADFLRATGIGEGRIWGAPSRCSRRYFYWGSAEWNVMRDCGTKGRNGRGMGLFSP